ncbi:YncE family protein [Bordetella bronchialis]|uniref:Uncharacterized protein n=1 Tax=Bordetella bronchialis TaxID=463025 RepID=A0A193FUI0_9BORD|nr:YncE family protein [Bordetella bronchialis]ANN70993.1 hypothetical protein BAU08_06300 [Bordetella bronchialis]
MTAHLHHDPVFGLLVPDTQTEAVTGFGNPDRQLQPDSVAFAPAVNGADPHKAYVGYANSNDVAVIDTITDTCIGYVTGYTGSQPKDLAFAPDGTKAYATNNNASTLVSVIDAKSDTQIRTVTGLPAEPYYVAFAPIVNGVDPHKAYVGMERDVAVIDTTTDTYIGSVTNFRGSGTLGVAFSPDGAIAYVTTEDNLVVVVDARKDNCTGIVAGYTGRLPQIAVFAPIVNNVDPHKAYVPSSETNTVAVIDTSTHRQTGTIGQFDGTFPYDAAFSMDGSKAYVPNANPGVGRVAVIDTATDTQVGTIANYTGEFPAAVAFSPDGTKAYCPNSGNNLVSVIRWTATPVRITSPTEGATVPKGTPIVVSGTGEPGMNVNVVLTYQGGRRDLNTSVQHDKTWMVNVGTPVASFTGRMDVQAVQTLGNLPSSKAASYFMVG